jgi:hypothetical protein
MTTISAQLPAPWTRPRLVIPYWTILLLVLAGVLLGSIAYFSRLTAAALYVPCYLMLCWYRPELALGLMFAEVSFPYDVAENSPVKMALSEISLCLALPVFWFKSLSVGHRRIFNPIALPIGAYFLICMISTLVNWNGKDALVSFFQMVIYLVIAVKFFSSYVPYQRQMYAAFYGLIASCTAVSLIMVATRNDYVLGIHKNASGGVVAFAVIVLAEFWLSAAARGRRRKWLTILLAVNIAGLVMSTCRGGWLGALAGLGVLLIFRRQYGLFAKALLVMIPAIAACWMILPRESKDYALDVGASSHNVRTRLDSIQFAKTRFMADPALGSGIGLRKEYDATNVIMSTLAETGVPGLGAFLAIHAALLWTIARTMRSFLRTDTAFSLLALGAALLVCRFTHGCVDHYWARSQAPVWGAAGMAIGIHSAHRYRAKGFV